MSAITRHSPHCGVDPHACLEIGYLKLWEESSDCFCVFRTELIGRVLLLYLHSLKLLAYTLVGLCGNIDWTILSIIEVAHMWAAVIYLVHTPHCDLLEHVKHRKEQLLQAANVWTAMQDVSFFYSPMNYCRISMSHAGDYDGMAELQSGFCRWQQEQRRACM